jgi:hypothetical protein
MHVCTRRRASHGSSAPSRPLLAQARCPAWPGSPAPGLCVWSLLQSRHLPVPQTRRTPSRRGRQPCPWTTQLALRLPVAWGDKRYL